MKKNAKELIIWFLLLLLCIVGLLIDIIYFLLNDLPKQIVNRFKTLKLWFDESF